MSVIVPTITASNPHEYREQMERVASFAKRIHIDFADGQFAPTKLVDINHVWWSEDKIIDLHLMYQQPALYIEEAVELQPNLIIVHAEADEAQAVLTSLAGTAVKRGVALLAETSVNTISDWLDKIDHVLVFGGRLGYQGGEADLALLDKVRALKQLKPTIEVSWDGGVNADNAGQLAAAGVDVLNVGGFIQAASDPAAAYATLKGVIQDTNHEKTEH